MTQGQRDEAIERYYRARSDADRERERAWGELGAEAMKDYPPKGASTSRSWAR